jgi:hypothetical protein
MYYFAASVVALLISMKYTHQTNEDQNEQMRLLQAKVELIEERNKDVDKEMLQKVMGTVMPIAKAVNKLNQTVGL